MPSSRPDEPGLLAAIAVATCLLDAGTAIIAAT